MEYLCSDYLYLWANFLHWFFRWSIELHSTGKFGHESFPFYQTVQWSTDRCDSLWTPIFSGSWTDFFSFKKWFLEHFQYPRSNQMWVLKPVSQVVYINVRKNGVRLRQLEILIAKENILAGFSKGLYEKT